jgi:hypothetical protein
VDFGNVIVRSWHMVWRYRFLWVLGILAGGGIGTCSAGLPTSNFNFNTADLANLGLRIEDPMQAMAVWINQNAGLVLLLVGLLVVLAIVCWILSLIFEGALVSATAELILTRPSSFGRAWRDGLHFFWRFFGLFWLILIIQLVLMVIVALPSTVIFIAAGTGETICFGFLWVLVAGLAWIVIQVLLGMIVPYAYRAMVLENRGPLQGIRFGWNLFRRNIGQSFLALALSLLLAAGGSILIIVVFFIILLILAIPTFLLIGSSGFGGAIVIFVAFAALIVGIVVLILGGIYNAYFYSYWTIVYLNLTGRLGRSLEIIPTERPPYTEGGAPPIAFYRDIREQRLARVAWYIRVGDFIQSIW